jgi:hypothetical protein
VTHIKNITFECTKIEFVGDKINLVIVTVIELDVETFTLTDRHRIIE